MTKADVDKIEEKTDVEAVLSDADILASVPPEELKTLEDMIRAGVLYGHKKSRTNPKFRPYINTTRNGIEIIDIPQTLPLIDTAVEFLKEKKREGKDVLVVATQPAFREIGRSFAAALGFSYINKRWIGGLLTNFKIISGRIEFWKTLKSNLAAGRLDKYTKKERVLMQRNADSMSLLFDGLENLKALPAALFIVDTSVKGHSTALREARRLNIPVVAVIDNDDNPEFVDHPIPANDHSRLSVEWILTRLQEGMAKGGEDLKKAQSSDVI